MIRSSIFVAILFCILLIIEASAIWVFDGWFAAVPLMMIAGFLVLQRVGIPEGIAWFCALAVLRADIVAGVIALIGPFVALRVFSTRSLYALFGIGLVSHAAGILVLFLIHTMHSAIFHEPWQIAFGTVWLQELLLIPGLYVGMSFVQWYKSAIGSRVAFRSLT